MTTHAQRCHADGGAWESDGSWVEAEKAASARVLPEGER